MADTTQKSDAGIGGTGEDATSKTPIDAGRNVGAGRAGGTGTVADDGTRAERYAGKDSAQTSGAAADAGADDLAAGADIDNDRRPILGSGTIGVGAGDAADRPPKLTDAAPAYVPRDVYGTGDRGGETGSGRSTGNGGRGASASGDMGPDAAEGHGGDRAGAPGGLAEVSGEQPPAGSDPLHGPEKPGILHGLDDQRPGR